MNLDFLEIGTSNFETMLETCGDDQLGMSVEPLLIYLNDLPTRTNVQKVHAAITHKKESDIIQIFYIPPNVIDDQNLPHWFKGCNRVGTYHPLHVKHNVQSFVTIETVPLLNVDEFMTMYGIKHIQYLKIDTEGHDSVILQGFYDFFVKSGKEYCPSVIQFETNENTPKDVVEDVISMYATLGYRIKSRGYDTLLEYKPRNNVHSL